MPRVFSTSRGTGPAGAATHGNMLSEINVTSALIRICITIPEGKETINFSHQPEHFQLPCSQTPAFYARYDFTMQKFTGHRISDLHCSIKVAFPYKLC
jgi:hypothetical protein